MSNKKQILSEIKINPEIKVIDDILEGFKKYRVLVTALDLDLFDILKENEKCTREEIVDKTKMNGMFSRSFLTSLVEIGLLNYNADEEKYSNSQIADIFLVKTSCNYFGDWIAQQGGVNSRWNNLSKIFMKNEPNFDTSSSGPDPKFLKALGQCALRGELQEVVKSIANWDGFKNAHTVLDLGGGHGLYTIALCQLNPDLKGVIVDKPSVVKLTEEIIESYDLSDRIDVIGADIAKADFEESKYDIVLISHLLYKFRRELPNFFKKVHKLVSDNGIYVANHWFCNPGCGDKFGILELDKSLQSFGHPLCHPDRFYNLFEETGFSVFDEKEIESIYGPSHLYIALKKPELNKKNSCSSEGGCCC